MAMIERHEPFTTIKTRYMCSICGKKFVRPQNFRLHFKRVHGGKELEELESEVRNEGLTPIPADTSTAIETKVIDFEAMENLTEELNMPEDNKEQETPKEQDDTNKDTGKQNSDDGADSGDNRRDSTHNSTVDPKELEGYRKWKRDQERQKVKAEVRKEVEAELEKQAKEKKRESESKPVAKKVDKSKPKKKSEPKKSTSSVDDWMFG